MCPQPQTHLRGLETTDVDEHWPPKVHPRMGLELVWSRCLPQHLPAVPLLRSVKQASHPPVSTLAVSTVHNLLGLASRLTLGKRSFRKLLKRAKFEQIESDVAGLVYKMLFLKC